MSEYVNEWNIIPWGDDDDEDEFWNDEPCDIEEKPYDVIKLDAKQRRVVDVILKGAVRSLYLTGEGGSGKSEIIKTITREARELNKRVLILAPTNAAAKNIGGVTVHRAFGLSLEVNEDADKVADVHVVRANAEKLEERFKELNIKSSDIIIIDEISMGGGLFAKVIKLLRAFEKRKNGTLSTLLLVGDPKQLPPVKDNQVEWSKKCNETVELTINYRTANKELAAEILKYRDNPSDAILDSVDTIRSIRAMGYNAETKYIAYKNTTLSSLQTILLGDMSGWVGMGDYVNVFGTSTDHHVVAIDPLRNELSEIPYFTNGDKLRVTSRAVPLPEKEYKGLFEIEVVNDEYAKLPCIPNDRWSSPTPRVITGDYNLYQKILNELFNPISVFKEKLTKKYKEKKTKYLKSKMNKDELKEWNRLWRNFFHIKNRPFARHHNFVTAHKAQGQSIKNVVVMWDEMAGEKLKYVAVSRAKENLTIVTRLSKN